jgi:CBS domain-containing protein
MRVEEIMSEAVCCREGDSVKECARIMKESSIGFVPICDAAGNPVAAVTDRDLTIRVLAEGRSASDRISDFATRGVVACRVGDDVREVERLMRSHRISRIMVCDDEGKLEGVVSLADIVDVASDEAAGETLQQVKSDQPPAAH